MTPDRDALVAHLEYFRDLGVDGVSRDADVAGARRAPRVRVPRRGRRHRR